jgi:hypothetical protein
VVTVKSAYTEERITTMLSPDKDNSAGERSDENDTDRPFHLPADYFSSFGLSGLDPDFASSYMGAELNDAPSLYPPFIDLTMDEEEQVSQSGGSSQSIPFPFDTKTEGSHDANQGGKGIVKEDGSETKTEGPKPEHKEPDKKSKIVSDTKSENLNRFQEGLSRSDRDQFMQTLPAQDNIRGPIQPGSGKLDVVNVESWNMRGAFVDFMNGIPKSPTDSGVGSERREGHQFTNNVAMKTTSLGVKPRNTVDLLAPNEWTYDKTATPKIQESQDEEPKTRAFPAINPNSLPQITTKADDFDFSLFPHQNSANMPILIESGDSDDSDDSKSSSGDSEHTGDSKSDSGASDNTDDAEDSDDSGVAKSEDDEIETEVDPNEQVDDDTFGKLEGDRVLDEMVDQQFGEEADYVGTTNTEPNALPVPTLQENAGGENKSKSGPRDTALSMDQGFLNRKSPKRRLSDLFEDHEDHEDEENEGSHADGQPKSSSAVGKIAHPTKPDLPEKAQLPRRKRTVSEINRMREIAENLLNARGPSKQSSEHLQQTEGFGTKAAPTSSWAAEPIDTPIIHMQNQYAWFYEKSDKVDGNDNEAVAARFAAIKEDYMAKKHAKKLTLAEEIDFIQAGKREAARLNRLEIDENFAAAAEDESGSQAESLATASEDGLLIPIDESPRSAPKRLHSGTQAETEEEDILDSRRKRSKKNKSYTQLTDYTLQDGMFAGFEAGFDKRERKKPANEKGAAKKNAMVEAKGRESSRTSKADVNGPDFDADAVPPEDLSFANSEEELILKATVELGRENIKPDGNGGWALNGMKTSLTNHQVLGAAWMRAREAGTDEPLGGLVTGDMNFGKHVQILACMASNPPLPETMCKATLLVVQSTTVGYWASEIHKHVEKNALGPFVTYYGKGKLQGSGAAQVLQNAGILLTTYSEVTRSYPKFKPPKELTGLEKIKEWWNEYYIQERGVPHKLAFFRVVLDEAQAIQNCTTHTSTACRGLVSKHRWAISGNPIQSSAEEVRTLRNYLPFCDAN